MCHLQRFPASNLLQRLKEKEAEILIAKRQAEEALREKDTEYHREMQEQRRELEAEMAKVREGQAIMESRVKEMRERNESRDQAMRQAEAARRKHSTRRTAVRFLAGIGGAGLCLVTGGKC